MRVLTTLRLVFIVSILTALYIVAGGSGMANAQKQGEHRKTFTGPHDSEYPYPVAEGKIGQRDTAAIAEISQSVTSMKLFDQPQLEAKGSFKRGDGTSEQHYSVSIVIGKNRRFRLDVEEGNKIRSVRISGNNGQARHGDGPITTLSDTAFGDPLAMPYQLLELTDRKDAAVVDDGVFIVGEQRLNKVTITLFQSQIGNPVAASFYFDSETHLLKKCAFINHSMSSSSLEYLKVVTYGDYHQDQSIVVPHEYSESIDGQLLMTIKVTSLDITSRHDDSYFIFQEGN